MSLLTGYAAHKPMLFSIAYKMTNNVMDAEDILQDLYIALSDKDDQPIRQVEHYLTKAVMNKCLTLIEKRKHIVYDGIDLPVPLLQGHFPDVHQQDVSYAVVVLLQQLNPVERAVFILRETLDYEYDEIAEIVALKPDHCRKLFQRAKEKIAAKPAAKSPEPDACRRFTTIFLDVCAKGDVETLLNYLKDDIVIYSDGGGKVVAARKPVVGKQNCIAFITSLFNKFGHDFQYELHAMNNTYGLVLKQKTDLTINTIVVFDYDENFRVRGMYYVRNPDKLACYQGLV